MRKSVRRRSRSTRPPSNAGGPATCGAGPPPAAAALWRAYAVLVPCLAVAPLAALAAYRLAGGASPGPGGW
jgi:hypothetical protein